MNWHMAPARSIAYGKYSQSPVDGDDECDIVGRQPDRS